MGQIKTYKALLISNQHDKTGNLVYAALLAKEEALGAVATAIGCDVSQVAVVGGMARDMVRALKLKPGEVRPI